ncbi:hypothetical protein E3P89_00452 [Wallemia ichthyophaga]|uniref:Uncharacterized protein n=1 Tax=Wallemia ichthyophaga TaxID=245174 RepID=A0A4V4M2W0_WALIC|nr:hypothetical protein E3P90_00611 [Wallemia ichthyophaga]TIB17786.1 hypothetical protein E3P93_00468 [Wallemia ichthyophaga]TIB25554.1 hypothetical protein E3P89_00452 [Wallemia ichthyophaga]TIB26994.1 hypothetical protein E3P88_00480 [Wallemia ichthyophaga]
MAVTLGEYQAGGLRMLDGEEVDEHGVGTIPLAAALPSGHAPVKARKKGVIDNSKEHRKEYCPNEPASARLRAAVADFQAAYRLTANEHAVLQAFTTYIKLPMNVPRDPRYGHTLKPNGEREYADIDTFLADPPTLVATFAEVFLDQFAFDVDRIACLPALLSSFLSFVSASGAVEECTSGLSRALDVVRGPLRSFLASAARILSAPHLGAFNRAALFAFDIWIDAPQYGVLRYVDDIERVEVLEEDRVHCDASTANTPNSLLSPLARDQVYSQLLAKSLDDIPLLVQHAAMKMLGEPVQYTPTVDTLPDAVLCELRRVFAENTATHQLILNKDGVQVLNRYLSGGGSDTNNGTNNGNVRHSYRHVFIERSVRQISRLDRYSEDLWLVALDSVAGNEETRRSKAVGCSRGESVGNSTHTTHSAIVTLWDTSFVRYVGGVDALIGIKLDAFFHKVQQVQQQREHVPGLPESWWVVNLVHVLRQRQL